MITVKNSIIILILISVSFYPQTDWEKWDKAEFDYRLPDNFKQRDYSFDTENTGKLITKSVVNAYWFFISDVDGDNCPFRPSCSSFFVDAVEETNILQGTLMFFDRFTRDLNIFKKGNYPVVHSGHFHDPASLYTLSENKIKYIPPNEIIISE
jgi:putative component of membrane protein insertase Oxa1/YidC/SpoIIIJ protein YidD